MATFTPPCQVSGGCKSKKKSDWECIGCIKLHIPTFLRGVLSTCSEMFFSSKREICSSSQIEGRDSRFTAGAQQNTVQHRRKELGA